MGCFHLPCIIFKAGSCVSSPPATISFKCLSSAFITSSAVFPWKATSHGPPICLHVIVFILTSLLLECIHYCAIELVELKDEREARKSPSRAGGRGRP